MTEATLLTREELKKERPEWMRWSPKAQDPCLDQFPVSSAFRVMVVISVPDSPVRPKEPVPSSELEVTSGDTVENPVRGVEPPVSQEKVAAVPPVT
jgi:hypothetical protein